MKTGILSFILSVVACVGLTACGDDTWNDGAAISAEGSVSLASVKVDVNDDETVVSRAVPSTDAFIVEINSTDGSVKRSYAYGSMPEVISLPVGDYTITVRSHKVQSAEWDAPYYLGSATFKVEAGQITEIGTIRCKFSNIKVTIKYTKELASYLGDDARVKVIANNRGLLDFTATETRAGYFEAIEGSTTLVAEFSATIQGNSVKATKTFTDVAAGEHHIITFSVKNGAATMPDEYGTIAASGIMIDADIEHENLNSSTAVGDENKTGSTVRPGAEEWPDDPTPGPGPDVPDDPVTGEAITITPSRDDLKLDGTPNPLEDGKSYVVKILADSGIENLNVNISSDNSDFEGSAGEMIPLSFDLAHVDPEATNSIDLKLVDVFNNELNLPCNEAVLGKPDATFDVTGLVPMLVAFPGTHTFSIEVIDKDGNKRSVQLAIFIPKKS